MGKATWAMVVFNMDTDSGNSGKQEFDCAWSIGLEPDLWQAFMYCVDELGKWSFDRIAGTISDLLSVALSRCMPGVQSCVHGVDKAENSLADLKESRICSKSSPKS